MIRGDDDNFPERALMLEINGQQKQGRPKQIWRRPVEASVKRNGMEVEEVANRPRWREGVRTIAEGMRCIQPLLVIRSTPYYNWITTTTKLQKLFQGIEN